MWTLNLRNCTTHHTIKTDVHTTQSDCVKLFFLSLLCIWHEVQNKESLQVSTGPWSSKGLLNWIQPEVTENSRKHNKGMFGEQFDLNYMTTSLDVCSAVSHCGPEGVCSSGLIWRWGKSLEYMFYLMDLPQWIFADYYPTL